MTGRVCVTGDIHRRHGVTRLGATGFPAGQGFDRDDYVIVAGDVGHPWRSDIEGCDRCVRDYLSALPYTVLFVDGNHENFDVLDAMPEVAWHGGLVHVVLPNVLHLMRGQVFDVCGRRIFVMGGARSTDRVWRTPGVSWWPREMPDRREYDRALASLDACGWSVDYVVTHCAPANFQSVLNPAYGNDELTAFLFRDVERKLSYAYWLFGHYHEDVCLEQKGYSARCLLNNFAELPPV